MSTSRSLASWVLAFVLGIAFAAIAVASVAKAEITPPIFLTRLYATISTYPATAGFIVGGHFVEGGGVRATSTSGAVVPLVFTDFDEENLIDVTLNVADATLSFPASSTIKELPSSASTNHAFCASSADAGRKRTLIIRNATTTATMDLTITGGTGVTRKQATSTGVVIPGDTDGLNTARVEMICMASTDIVLNVQVFKD